MPPRRAYENYVFSLDSAVGISQSSPPSPHEANMFVFNSNEAISTTRRPQQRYSEPWNQGPISLGSTRCEDSGANSIPTREFYPGPAANRFYGMRDQQFVQDLPVDNGPGLLSADFESGVDVSGDWKMQDVTSGYIWP